MSATQALQDLAPTGVLRAAINFGNPVLAQPGSANGPPQGVSVARARELGRRLGVDIAFVRFDAAGKVVEALPRNLWDIAFLAIDPARATGIAFTAPYVVIEGTYIVRDDSPLRATEDFDRRGVRMAVGAGAAYDLFLTRTLKMAALVRTETSRGAIDACVAHGYNAAAGVRQPLEAFAREHPGFRVIHGGVRRDRAGYGNAQGEAARLDVSLQLHRGHEARWIRRRCAQPWWAERDRGCAFNIRRESRNVESVGRSDLAQARRRYSPAERGTGRPARHEG